MWTILTTDPCWPKQNPPNKGFSTKYGTPLHIANMRSVHASLLEMFKSYSRRKHGWLVESYLHHLPQIVTTFTIWPVYLKCMLSMEYLNTGT